MPNSNPELILSIVIINYNTTGLVLDCITSIKRETKKILFEIIVIDNNSPDKDHLRIVKKFPDIQFIENKENMGFGVANNQGIDIAKGEYILLLNSDTTIIDNAIEKCIEFMDSGYAAENNIGLLGCNIKNPDRSNQRSTFERSNIWGYLLNGNPVLNKIRSINKKNSRKFEFRKGQFVVGVSGAFMLFRASVFERIKPFDPDLFMYSEETELCRNRVNKYFNSYYWPGASIEHLGGQSAAKEILFHQNMLSYALTWYKTGYWNYILYIIISIVNFITSLILVPITSAATRKELKKVIKGYSRISYYLIFDIPRYSKEWGSRKRGLKLAQIE